VLPEVMPVSAIAPDAAQSSTAHLSRMPHYRPALAVMRPVRPARVRGRTPWAAAARQPGDPWGVAAPAHGGDHGRMTAWQDVEQAEPEFAKRVRALFDAHRHKTIATLRAD